MFLVQQMLETKRDEIRRLTEHDTMREDGLTCSETLIRPSPRLSWNSSIKYRTEFTALDEARKNKNEKTNELRQSTEAI